MSENLYGLLNVAKDDIETRYEGNSPIYVDNNAKLISLNYDDTLTIKGNKLSVKPQSAGVSSIKKDSGTAMTGDITLKAGTNVTIAENTTTKTLTINASGGSTGVTQIKAGNNISISPTTGLGVVTISGTEYYEGTGITIDPRNRINCNTYTTKKWTGAKDVDLGRYGTTDYWYGKLAGLPKSNGDNYIDIVEVTCDNSGEWGNVSWNIYTADDDTQVHIWAYHIGHGDVTHARVHFWTLYNSKLSTPLEQEYAQNKMREKENDIEYMARRHNMYIPDTQDIIISKNEQSFNLNQYIPNIYYSGQDGDVFKVDLNDCYVSPYDISKVGIQKVIIKYIGEHNKYRDPMSIAPATLYIKVVE